MSTNKPKSFLTKRELAERYQVSEKRVQQLMDSSIIPVYRLGDRIVRFDPEECDAALKAANA